jgi:protein-S-isoprenylcysteine O-methyltransferase Ste14
LLPFGRHLLAFLALPFMVTVVVPLYLLRRGDAWRSHLDPFPHLTLVALGVLLLGIGLALFVSSLRHFVTRGRGTLAPWDPPLSLVMTGPYRFVRNPMIAGVIFILFSEAFLLPSYALLSWAATFLVINLVYIPLLEEPVLALRFGEPYNEYRQHVRRFIPRLRPWTPKSAP